MDVLALLDHYGAQALILAALLHVLIGRGLAALNHPHKRKRKPKGEARGTAFRLRR